MVERLLLEPEPSTLSAEGVPEGRLKRKNLTALNPVISNRQVGLMLTSLPGRE